MKSKQYIIPLVLLTLIIFGGCTSARHGADLTGFCLRMNEANEQYNISPDGYIEAESGNIYRFFSFGENELALFFEADKSGKMTRMDIVADRGCLADTAVEKFINDALSAFINNSEEQHALLEKIPYSEFSVLTTDTRLAEYRSATMYLNVTEAGSVITVYIDR